MKNVLKNSIALVLVFNMTISPVFSAFAQGITVDGGAAASNQPDLGTAPNGVPLVNIVRPNGAGLSHNKYLDFNVTSQGVILNNSTTVGVSQLGGALNSNPNLVGTSGASIILNEVTSTNRSLLEGHTEIFGRSAEYILANPNGITCNGCGFINTPRSTLTTGTPTLAPGGALQSLSVEGGDVVIGGSGLDASALDYFDIVSRSAEINAAINARELTITTGRNDYDYVTRSASAKADDGSTAPAFALDSTALGGMYANRITLVGTEAGVGVRLAGDMAATGGDLSLNADGTLSVGKVTASNQLTLRSTNGDVQVNGNAYGGTTLSAEAGNGTVTFSTGTTSGAQNSVTLNAQNVTLEDNAALVAGLAADGKTTQAGALSTTVSDTFHNRKGLVSSGGDITLNAENLNNDEGILLAVDNIVLQGAAGGKSQSVINQSGTIETARGDITVRTENLTNRKKLFTTSTNEIYRENHAFSNQSHPGCNSVPGAGISPEGCAYFSGRDIAVVPHWERDNFTAYYSGFGTITDWVVESVVDQDSDAALISSGRDLTIEATNLQNSHSDISALNDIVITGTSLNNTGTKLTRDYYVYSSYGGHTRCYGGVCRWIEGGPGSALLERNEFAAVNATIMAGGNITGDIAGQIDNTTIVETADSLNIKRKNYINEVGDVTSTPDGDVPLLDITDLSDPGPLLVSNPDPTAPGPLIESRFEFTDLGTFYGSDYFLNANGLTPGDAQYEALPRRLGDAFVDTRLVRDAIIRQTGARWLNPAVRDDIAQMKALLDNGVAQAGALQLAVGVSLSEEQLAALTSDIVWYVTETVDGQEVLVPRLYLAQNSRSKLLPRGGAIAAGADLNLNAGQFLGNSGVLSAANDLNLEATENLRNSSGTISAGRNVRLVATNGDVINETASYELRTEGTDIQTVRNARGEILAGGTLDVVAGNDIVIRGADLAATGDAALSAGRTVDVTTIELRDKKHFSYSHGYTNIDSTNYVGSTVLTDGNLVITAGEDLSIKGSAVAAGGDLSLRATEDVTITAAADRKAYDFKSKKKTFGGSASREGRGLEITQQGSAVGAGNTLVIEAGEDARVTASGLNAGSDLSVTADNITLDTAENYDFDYSKRKKSGFFADGSFGVNGVSVSAGYRKEKHTKTEESITQVTSALGAGQDITLNARENVVVESANLQAGRDVTITAAESVDLRASQDLYNRQEEHKIKQVGITLSLQQNVTNAIESVAKLPKSATAGEGSAGAKGLTAASEVLRSVSAVMTAIETPVSASATLGVSSSEERTSESSSTARVASVSAGQNVTVTAGEDITGEGVQIAAGNDVTLDAGDDLELKSAQNTYNLDHESSSKSASVGVTAGIGPQGPSVSATATLAAHNAERSVDSLSHSNSRITSGGDTVLNSGDDTTLEGALVEAQGGITTNTGGDLTVASVQDTSLIDGNSRGGSIGLTTGISGGSQNHGDNPSPGAGGLGLNGSISAGREEGSKAWVSEQSGLIAKGDVDVNTGGHTQLDGAVIASTEGDVSIDTESFDYSDIQDHDAYENISGTLSGSVTLSEGQQSNSEPSLTDQLAALPTVDGSYESREREQITRATVAAPNGSATITIRANPDQGLEGLNSVLEKAQEITREKQTKVKVYIDPKAIGGVVDGVETILNELSALTSEDVEVGEGLAAQAEQLNDIRREAIRNGLSTEEAAQLIQDPEMASALLVNANLSDVEAYYAAKGLEIPFETKMLILNGVTPVFKDGELVLTAPGRVSVETVRIENNENGDPQYATRAVIEYLPPTSPGGNDYITAITETDYDRGEVFASVLSSAAPLAEGLRKLQQDYPDAVALTSKALIAVGELYSVAQVAFAYHVGGDEAVARQERINQALEDAVTHGQEYLDSFINEIAQENALSTKEVDDLKLAGQTILVAAGVIGGSPKITSKSFRQAGVLKGNGGGATNRISSWEGVDTTSRGTGADVPDNVAGWVKGPDGSSIPIQKTANGQPDWKRFLQDNAEVTSISGSVDSGLVRFTQSSISGNFSDGRSVDDLVTGLRNGTVDPSSLPPIRTFEVNGQLYSLDNRRLYAYQKAGIDVPTQPATTAEITRDTFKFTTPNGGQDILVRGR
ncbi:hemagglutinin repeat-containing protein [Kiloniella sp. b19]|uniref:hemagglutinin repeat-containing protein n=1 Tax=Kiloniella sp. GXU_MW_B19 TaxID=3141326 RepID=UPI0031DA4B11